MRTRAAITLPVRGLRHSWVQQGGISALNSVGHGYTSTRNETWNSACPHLELEDESEIDDPFASRTPSRSSAISAIRSCG